MQQFTVPQFIDVESKIIGPITARQFVIILSGFLSLVLLYKILRFTPFVLCAIVILAFCGLFSFLKINGMPFHFFLLNFLQTSSRPKLRVWNNHYGKDLVERDEEKVIHETPPPPPRRFSTSRLAELALIVDTQGTYKGEAKGSEMDIRLRE